MIMKDGRILLDTFDKLTYLAASESIYEVIKKSKHSRKFRTFDWYFHLVQHHLKRLSPNF